MVPINAGPPNYVAMGFAGFFLLKGEDYENLKGNDSACAEYIGAWTGGAPATAPGGTGAWKISLFR